MRCHAMLRCMGVTDDDALSRASLVVLRLFLHRVDSFVEGVKTLVLRVRYFGTGKDVRSESVRTCVRRTVAELLATTGTDVLYYCASTSIY